MKDHSFILNCNLVLFPCFQYDFDLEHVCLVIAASEYFLSFFLFFKSLIPGQRGDREPRREFPPENHH